MVLFFLFPTINFFEMLRERERNTFEYEKYCRIWKLRDMRFFMRHLSFYRAEYVCTYAENLKVIKYTYTYVKLAAASSRYFKWWLFCSNWSNLFSHFGCIKIFRTLYVYIYVYIKYISFLHRNYFSSSVMRHVRRRVARCASVFGISAIYTPYRLATELT